METRIKVICVATLAAFIVPSYACAFTTLYEQLGGLDNIRGIVSQTIDRTSVDPRTSSIFEGIRLAPVKESVANHLCEITDGPCKYEGAPMAKAHSGMQISSKQFDLMDNYLDQALTDHGVKGDAKSALAKLLQSLKPEIIDK